MDRTSGLLSPKIEAMSRDEVLARFSSEVARTIAHAYANAPAVKSLLDRAGISPKDVRTLDDLALVPVTPKAELVRMQGENPPFGGLLAVPMSKIRRIFRSPGPISDPQGIDEGWGWEEGLFACGFRPGDVAVNTFSYHMTPAGMMFDDSLGRLGCAVIPTGIGDREAQIDILRAYSPAGYVGMASFLIQIGQKAVEMGLDPRRDFALKAAFSTAEPLPDSLRNAVEDMFGLTLRQGYGTADCGCLAYECLHRGGMHLTTRAYVEIVDPTSGKPMAAGEVGEVVVTLFNEAYPLIRFGTGDLSAIDEASCACGRTSPKLRGWLGRADQLVKVKGQFVHPGLFQKAMAEFADYPKYRAVVTRHDNRDYLTVKFEAGAPPDGAVFDAMKRRLRDHLKIGCEVEVVSPGSLPSDGKLLDDTRRWD